MIFLFSSYGDWAVAALRIVLGLILSAHGWPKLKDMKTTGTNFAAMGFRPGAFWGPLVAIVEFFGGLALVLGLWTQIPALLVVGEFAVIMVWKLARKQPLASGYEFDLLILAAALVLLAYGAGQLSLDQYFFGIF